MVRVLYDLPAGYATPVDLQQVRQALEPAFHVASIQPRFAPEVIQRRAEISEEAELVPSPLFDPPPHPGSKALTRSIYKKKKKKKKKKMRRA